jgi:23S rRNA pseudouridine955/2504/2580 synthase
MSTIPATKSPGVSYVTIDADRAGQRIDNFLLSQWKGVPKSRVYRLLRKGEIRVNKGRIKADYKLLPGDLVRLPPIRLPESKPSPMVGERLRALMERSILYQDDQVLVLNKPPNMAVHGGSGIDLGVIETLRQQFDAPRWELVHRLDRETSGCLLVAKKRSALRQLQQQFREKQTRKVYLTLVAGFWPTRCHEVNLPLVKNQLSSGERIVKVSPEGKPALTQFKIQQRLQSSTLLEVGLVTGRTHQIRVHTQSQGHSILGDEKYGDKDQNKQFKQLGLNRLFLHAHQIHFNLPHGEGDGPSKRMSVEAPLAPDLQAVLDVLSRSEP